MKKTSTLPKKSIQLSALGLILCCTLLWISACSSKGRPTVFPPTNPSWEGQVATIAGSVSISPTEIELDIWPTFAPPSQDSVTPIPPAADRLALEEEVRVWALLGSENPSPQSGRTDAIHLLLINERIGKASVVSIPGDLFVYLPGHTMQRLNTAYALGGMKLVRDTLAYNFGIRPDRFVLAHPTEFKWLVDDLGGLDVDVLLPVREACGGLPAGRHSMNGEKAYCYVSFVSDDDEVDRTRRQQQVLQLLFTKLIQNGRLAKLPAMYLSYQDLLETDITLEELLERIPLALRLGDPQRINYFLIGWDHVIQWELPDNTQTQVLLPKLDVVAQTFTEAFELINQASPLGEIVLTYEAQLTEVIGRTQTAQPGLPTWPAVSATVTLTPTPWPTRTPTPTGMVTTATPTYRPTSTSSEPYPVPTVSFYTTTPYP